MLCLLLLSCGVCAQHTPLPYSTVGMPTPSSPEPRSYIPLHQYTPLYCHMLYIIITLLLLLFMGLGFRGVLGSGPLRTKSQCEVPMRFTPGWHSGDAGVCLWAVHGATELRVFTVVAFCAA